MRITNYYEHKGDSRYMVYEFYSEEKADHFESLLGDRKVAFERFFDENSKPPTIFFGVHKRFKTEGNDCNFLTHAHFRSPLIGNKILRYLLLVVTIGMITLALVGYFRAH